MDTVKLLDTLIFPVDAVLALLVYILPIYTVKKGRLFSAFILLAGAVGVFVFVMNQFHWVFGEINPLLQTTLGLSCYFIFFAVLLLLACYLFQIIPNDLFFIGLADYALQHIAYVVIHEITAVLIGFDWVRAGAVFVLVAVLARLGLYCFAYRLFCGKLRHTGAGNLTPRRAGKWIYLATLFLLVLQTIPNQGLFLTMTDSRRYLFAVLSILLCVLVLYAQYMTIQSIHQA